MRDITGWVGGFLGAAALVGAFHLGGRATASAPAEIAAPAVAEAAAPAAPLGIEVSCAPGQRVVMREATATTAAVAACVGTEVAPARVVTALAPAPVVEAPARPYVQRAAITEPVEVYRPRPVPVSYESVEERPVRTKTKSAVIIGSSTAVGATIGGLTKGTKGAVVGGLIGGGAATVWDQVTRRQGNDR